MARYAWLMVGVAGLASFAGGGAIAATAADSAAATTTVSDIVVTAEKRSENLEKVPVAVSAYTSKERDLVGIETIQDMTKFTPGLQYSTSLDRAFIRGVGRQTNNLASQPGVATYNDGVYNSSVVSAAGDSLFVDRVEVLRGPQGTLYGRNAIGGTINSISKRPTNDFYAEVRADAGNYGVYNFEGAVSGPIANGLGFRLAGYRDDQQDGYFKNLSGGPSEGGAGWVAYLEGQLQAEMGPVDAWVKADTAAWNESYRSGIGLGPYDEAAFPTGSLGPGAAFGFTQPGFTEVGSVTQNPATNNPRTFSTNTPNDSHLTNDYNVTTQVTWHTGANADLKYIGGFTRYLYNLTEDFDGTSITSYQFPTVPSGVCAPFPQCPPLTVFPTVLFNYREDKMYYSNELNLTSTGSGPFQWILGVYQYHEQYFQFVRIPLPDQPQLAAPLGAPANPSRDIYDINQHTSADSYAGFAQGDWQIVPTLKLTGGLRYTYDLENALESTRQLCLGLVSCGAPAAVDGAFTPALDITEFLISFAPAPGVKAPPTLNATTGFWSRPLGATWSAVTGTAGAEWTPDSESLLYAKYSRGYKAGGFNTGSIVAFPETKPEYIDAYEIGGKRDFGSQFQVNLALFYYNYDGMQIPLSVQPSSGPAQTQFFNMKQVVSYGAELETVWRPTDDLMFLFNYSYLNARIHDPKDCFIDSADPFAIEPGHNIGNCPVVSPPFSASQSQTVNGQVVPESPPNKIALNGNYTLHFDPGALTFSATYSWQDATYDSIFNRFYTKAPAYGTVDLRLLWNDAKNHYTIIVYGKNIFNALGYDNAGATLESNFVTLNRTFGLTPPATFGVELQYRL